LPPYDVPGVRPGGPPPVAPPPRPYDAPTPPQGYAAPPTHAAPAPYPAPRASAGPAYDPDPFAAPAEPVGRPAGTVGENGEYGDEIGRTRERRDPGPDELLDDPYRPGGGDLR
jgi:hypothetical protein